MEQEHVFGLSAKMDSPGQTYDSLPSCCLRVVRVTSELRQCRSPNKHAGEADLKGLETQNAEGAGELCCPLLRKCCPRLHLP